MSTLWTFIDVRTEKFEWYFTVWARQSISDLLYRNALRFANKTFIIISPFMSIINFTGFKATLTALNYFNFF